MNVQAQAACMSTNMSAGMPISLARTVCHELGSGAVQGDEGWGRDMRVAVMLLLRAGW